MSTYWAAEAVLPNGPERRVRLAVADGRFEAVRTGVDPEPDDRHLAGLVLPGFANTHSHAFHRALRGRTHAGGGSFWSWREQMYAAASRLDPDRYLALARAVFAEMALAGITVVGEFHYLHHAKGGRRYADPNAMSAALAEAARQAGVRLTLLDTCYLHGGLHATGYLPPDPVQIRFSDGSVEAWAERMAGFSAGGAGVRAAAAIHSVRAVSAADLTRLVDLVPPGPLHVHLGEQPAENEAVQAYYGCTPTELLDRHGLLGPSTTAVHAVHLAAADVERLGGTGTRICLCPTTERDLADGIPPAGMLSDAGCSLSLGSDQQAVIDMFCEIRGLEMHERLASLQRGRFRPDELIAAATEHGYASLGWNGGRIAPGTPADFIVVERQSVRTAGTRTDQLIYAATSADVRDVVVGGEWVVRDGQHRLGSVAAMLREALSALDDEA